MAPNTTSHMDTVSFDPSRHRFLLGLDQMVHWMLHQITETRNKKSVHGNAKLDGVKGTWGVTRR